MITGYGQEAGAPLASHSDVNKVCCGLKTDVHLNLAPEHIHQKKWSMSLLHIEFLVGQKAYLKREDLLGGRKNRICGLNLLNLRSTVAWSFERR